MLVLGDVSGIQSWVFDVPESGGGQARRLRSRSFFVQMIAESSLLRMVDALDWSPCESVVFASAGKCLLRGQAPSDAEGRLKGIDGELNDWLLREARGDLRFSVCWYDGAEPETDQFRALLSKLQRVKLRPWGRLLASQEWDTGRLVSYPLGHPCDLCRRQTAQEEETDDETGVVRRICVRCASDREVGRRLPRSRWIRFSRAGRGHQVSACGLHVHLIESAVPPWDSETVGLSTLFEGQEAPPTIPADRILQRRLARHVPTTPEGPVDFTDLARRSRGDHLLAILKADVDSLGAWIDNLTKPETVARFGFGLDHIRVFTQRLDRFFAAELQDQLPRHDRWKWIYTVFSGGDDLLLVGPWDAILDFAGHVRQQFRERFARLTLSAGIAFAKPKRPIKQGIHQAEALLEQAKTGPKNQCAAFGQVWSWDRHDAILREGRQLADWCDAGRLQRGWLQTMLRFAMDRFSEPVPSDSPNERSQRDFSRLMAPARLAAFVGRNFPRKSDRDRLRAEVGNWGDRILRDFEHPTNTDAQYLPAVLRYAITATRKPNEEDRDE